MPTHRGLRPDGEAALTSSLRTLVLTQGGQLGTALHSIYPSHEPGTVLAAGMLERTIAALLVRRPT